LDKIKLYFKSTDAGTVLVFDFRFSK